MGKGKGQAKASRVASTPNSSSSSSSSPREERRPDLTTPPAQLGAQDSHWSPAYYTEIWKQCRARSADLVSEIQNKDTKLVALEAELATVKSMLEVRDQLHSVVDRNNPTQATENAEVERFFQYLYESMKKLFESFKFLASDRNMVAEGKSADWLVAHPRRNTLNLWGVHQGSDETWKRSTIKQYNNWKPQYNTRLGELVRQRHELSDEALVKVKEENAVFSERLKDHERKSKIEPTIDQLLNASEGVVQASSHTFKEAKVLQEELRDLKGQRRSLSQNLKGQIHVKFYLCNIATNMVSHMR
ncbi:hypothetical protein F5050DRAFT_1714895 [Lentinula boryana]|uniref:Uncharacterized protein n=1 Tax=Lentinula boryana TaxID=40481 RepID=A0ABQ8Q360_9AGAR|nr:hypothetical protein F5050DRAFT_1714895 [Lentinula boryana]